MPFRRLLSVSLAAGFSVFVAACQPGGKGLDLGMGKSAEPEAPKVSQAELRAFCPNVELREGTAFFNKYKSGAKKRAAEIEPLDDATQRPGEVVFQASIADVTRSCSFSGGQTVMTVAVAGKIVPGAAFSPGSIVMPIRVVATRGTEVLYSQLHQYQVQVSNPTEATQFVFSDQEVVLSGLVDRNVRVYAGYDEGPVKKPAETQ